MQPNNNVISCSYFWLFKFFTQLYGVHGSDQIRLSFFPVKCIEQVANIFVVWLKKRKSCLWTLEHRCMRVIRFYILYVTPRGWGSRCKSIKTGVITVECSKSFIPRIKRAAALNTVCNNRNDYSIEHYYSNLIEYARKQEQTEVLSV